MTIEVSFALVLSVISVVFSIFFSHKSSKKSDTKEIEERVARETKTDMKLDEITRNTSEIKDDLRSVKTDVKEQAAQVVLIKASVERAHSRIDTISNTLNIKTGGKEDV